jgi:hypothetical protein
LLHHTGRWKCTSCDRFHCIHANWVAQHQQAQDKPSGWLRKPVRLARRLLT